MAVVTYSDHFVVADIIYKVAVITSSLAKITFVVAGITRCDFFLSGQDHFLQG